MTEFEFPLETEEELKGFVTCAWGVQIPDKRVCDEHSTPWEVFAEAYFARERVTIWKASRALAGKSFLLALLGLTEAVTLGADVSILGGSGEQANRVHAYSQDFWNHDAAPRRLLAGDPTKRRTEIAYGNKIQTLTASQRSIRGPHPQRLRIDEVDEVKLDILNAALGQPLGEVDVPGQTVLSSTHTYADGTFTEMLSRAAERGYPVREWCWRETVEPHGWLPRSEVEAKRTEIPVEMWRVEFELGEPSPESRAIQPEQVAAMFDPGLGSWQGRNGQYVEIEPPQPGARYTTGADWARKEDFTVVVTLRTDVRPFRLVAFERMRRRPWPTMVAHFDERLEHFGGRAVHDATGLGDVVAGYMEHSAQDVIMSGRSRDDLLSDYIALVEDGGIVSPMIDFLYSEHKYASVDDLFGRGHLPDGIAAMALANKAARLRRRTTSLGVSGRSRWK